MGFDVALKHPGKFFTTVCLEDLVAGGGAQLGICPLPGVEDLVLGQLGHAHIGVVCLDDDAGRRNNSAAAPIGSIVISRMDQPGHEGDWQACLVSDALGDGLHLLVVACLREYFQILRVRSCTDPQLLGALEIYFSSFP